MYVKELMNPHVWSVHAGDSLEAATRTMWNEDVGALPVVDEWNHPIGMVTDRDIAMCAAMNGKPLIELHVSNCMSSQVHTCQDRDTIEAAAGVMRAQQVRRLPVVDESQRLVGILTLNDLAHAAWSLKESKTRRAIADEVVRTLAAVTEPREGRVEDEAVIEVMPAVPSTKEKRSAGKSTTRKSSRRS